MYGLTKFVISFASEFVLLDGDGWFE